MSDFDDYEFRSVRVSFVENFPANHFLPRHVQLEVPAGNHLSVDSIHHLLSTSAFLHLVAVVPVDEIEPLMVIKTMVVTVHAVPSKAMTTLESNLTKHDEHPAANILLPSRPVLHFQHLPVSFVGDHFVDIVVDVILAFLVTFLSSSTFFHLAVVVPVDEIEPS